MNNLNTTTTNTTEINEQTPKRPPVITVDHFPLRAAVWDNVTGEGEVFFSITFERAYKKDDKWNSSRRFRRSDPLALSKLANTVDTEIREMLDADREARRTQGQAD